MRMGHLERSCFLRRTASGSWLRAYRGKGRDSTGSRPAFNWNCPLLSTGDSRFSAHAALARWVGSAEQVDCSLPQYVMFEPPTGLKVSGQQISEVRQEPSSTSLGTSQAALLTSYCWRRVASTLANPYRPSVVQANPFGWLGRRLR